MTTTTITAEFLSPHDFVAHPDNRPGGLKDDHIETLAADMRAKGFDEDYFVKYCVPDDTWPAEYSALAGKRVLLGGHHRTEAAKRANIARIPAKLKPMTYAETLEFLDRDNDYSPLHWYEKGILHEKRRALLGLTAIEYGEKILKQPTPERGNQYMAQTSITVRRLLDYGISTNDLIGVSETGCATVTRIAPPSAWIGIFKEMQAGSVPTGSSRLREVLKARYSPVASLPAVPNHTSYLYIATSPHTALVKCGMTTGDDPVKYVAGKATGTWVLDFSCYFSVEIPTVHIQAADALMRDKLGKGWPAFREFYTIKPNAAKRILLEIAAKFADDEED